ncbi:Protein kinase-like domain [Trinorchestia longiramus]|nr:Protein kinase-like domain [Trinorchestia longiramus]
MVALPGQSYIGTECWSPPEAVFGVAPITDRADIFAFGLTIWECLTLDSPHVHVLCSEDDEENEKFLTEEEQQIKSEEREEKFQQLIGTRPLLPASVATLGFAYTPFLENFYHCTNSEPSQRPSASQLVQIFALLDMPSDNLVSDLSNLHYESEQICTEKISNSSSNIDESLDIDNASLTSSYFTNETLALGSKSFDQSEKNSTFEEDKSHNEKSCKSTADESHCLPELNRSSSSSLDVIKLLAQETKIKVEKSRDVENGDADSSGQINEVNGKAFIRGDIGRNRAAKRPLEENNDPDLRKKIQISSL